MNSRDAILVLEDGNYFKGYGIGKFGTTIGELCFNTSLTGYQEIFSDPSYYGQLLVMNHIHIGNYGTVEADMQSAKLHINGLIVNYIEPKFSREKYLAQDIQNLLINNDIIGIQNIDTRSLVKHIREKGAMRGIISSDIVNFDELFLTLKNSPNTFNFPMDNYVSTSVKYELNPNGKFKIAVLDYGIKLAMLKHLENSDMNIHVFPSNTDFKEIMAIKPDGFFLSNGPGDPSVMTHAISTAKCIMHENLPTFGICLGHQLMALANGLKTFKMHHGHRGANHPVLNTQTGLCEITTQNHGYAVSLNDVDACNDLLLSHINLNDRSVEGLVYKNRPMFSVQFHPENAPGPHDSLYLFEQFKNLLIK